MLQDSRNAAAGESQVRSIYQFVKTHNNLTGGLVDALAAGPARQRLS